jgi:hypothetical protein
VLDRPSLVAFRERGFARPKRQNLTAFLEKPSSGQNDDNQRLTINAFLDTLCFVEQPAPLLPPEELADRAFGALEDQCNGVCRELHPFCTRITAAALTWLTKGLEQIYGTIAIEQAKEKFAAAHKLNTGELLMMKSYIIRFHDWEDADWSVVNRYIDLLGILTPQQACEQIRTTHSNVERPATIRFVKAFWAARPLERIPGIKPDADVVLSDDVLPKD